MTDKPVQAFKSQEGAVIFARLSPGTDLLEGIRVSCMQHHVQYGSMVSCIGSLEEAVYVYPSIEPNAPMGIQYGAPINVKGALELVSCQGTIGQDQGEYSLHMHGIFLDENARVYAGHFLEGCKVLVTVELTILELKGAKLERRLDKEVGFSLFKIYKN